MTSNADPKTPPAVDTKHCARCGKSAKLRQWQGERQPWTVVDGKLHCDACAKVARGG